MSNYDHWTTEDWLRHYAPTRSDVAADQTGGSGAATYQTGGHYLPVATHQVGARQGTWGPAETCPTSLVKPLLILGALGFVGWKVFSPKVRETARERGWGSSVDKKAAGLAGLAAQGLGRASSKIGEGAQNLSKRAERFAKHG